VNTLPQITDAVRLLLERLEYTSERLVQLASMQETDYHDGMAGELKEANAAFSRFLFGYEYSTDAGGAAE